MGASERLTIEVYHDILRALHVLHKTGRKASPYNVGYEARMPSGRLKDRVGTLSAMGLVDSAWGVTSLGYEYFDDFTRNVAPFLRKYGLGGKDH